MERSEDHKVFFHFFTLKRSSLVPSDPCTCTSAVMGMKAHFLRKGEYIVSLVYVYMLTAMSLNFVRSEFLFVIRQIYFRKKFSSYLQMG